MPIDINHESETFRLLAIQLNTPIHNIEKNYLCETLRLWVIRLNNTNSGTQFSSNSMQSQLEYCTLFNPMLYTTLNLT